MELESQVCSLELSKQLKGIGVKQESLFYWISLNHKNIYTLAIKDEFNKAYHEKDIISAFTVAELGELLPFEVSGMSLKIFKSPTYYNIGYDNFKYTIYDKSEADARAKMLIYLIENRIIETTK